MNFKPRFLQRFFDSRSEAKPCSRFRHERHSLARRQALRPRPSPQPHSRANKQFFVAHESLRAINAAAEAVDRLVVETKTVASPCAPLRASNKLLTLSSRLPEAIKGRDNRDGLSRLTSSRREHVSLTSTPVFSTSSKLRLSISAPPPSATTNPFRFAALISAVRSSRRNIFSPRFSNSAATLFPADRSIAASKSTKGLRRRRARSRPTADFPVPMNPVKYTVDLISAKP